MLSRTKKILIALCLSVVLLSQFASMNVFAIEPPTYHDDGGSSGSGGSDDDGGGRGRGGGGRRDYLLN